MQKAAFAGCAAVEVYRLASAALPAATCLYKIALCLRKRLARIEEFLFVLLGTAGSIEHSFRMLHEQLLVTFVPSKPPQCDRIETDSRKVVVHAVEEIVPLHSCIAGIRGVADKFAAFAAFCIAMVVGKYMAGHPDMREQY